MIINNIKDLAKYLDVSVNEIAASLEKYTDSHERIEHNKEKITIWSKDPYNDFKLSYTLFYPFCSDDFDNIQIKLECCMSDVRAGLLEEKQKETLSLPWWQ